ncbi:peptidoglycan DD-metalloendopeptidase family protein [Pseudorhodoferax sp. Leaf267]|uniref:peptidoglycan DD-metalloendopeptidase family protein n=1 Tax=Pseudorhodoferax sp. Leaf267 TaxID=1736316 RepID=UPI0006F7C1A9|nr:peptidoglycan DD-metalloendopeptidase family protein [Pseudorhodoferax sp. Leaf267]KQP14384.1 peptidase [Pseudorhodoferax sp. Leaf267]
MDVLKVRRWHTVLALVAVLALGACASRNTPVRGAPVESRGTSVGENLGTAPAEAPRPVDPNAGKPGYYTVKPGDTLIRIGLDTGQNWRDIARWNAMENPNLIEVGQALRVTPPPASSVAAAEGGVLTRPVAPASAAAPTPLGPAGASSAPRPGTTVATAPVAPPPAPVASAVPAPAPMAPPVAAPSGGDGDDMAFIWPTSGNMISGFDEVKNKGVDLAGRAGDAVLAAADGKVVYAGAGLRGYGNLVILKHNNTYLTAYAHNQTLLVKEDQTVRKGQKVAEMGSSDADRVKLHFEIRRQGKPVDPMKYLPARPAP